MLSDMAGYSLCDGVPSVHPFHKKKEFMGQLDDNDNGEKLDNKVL